VGVCFIYQPSISVLIDPRTCRQIQKFMDKRQDINATYLLRSSQSYYIHTHKQRKPMIDGWMVSPTLHVNEHKCVIAHKTTALYNSIMVYRCCNGN